MLGQAITGSPLCPLSARRACSSSVAAFGIVTTGSPDVYVNKRPAARKDDKGLHAACCGPNKYDLVKGSPNVYVNGKPFARNNDQTKHCGGSGKIIEGSPKNAISTVPIMPWGSASETK